MVRSQKEFSEFRFFLKKQKSGFFFFLSGSFISSSLPGGAARSRLPAWVGGGHGWKENELSLAKWSSNRLQAKHGKEECKCVFAWPLPPFKRSCERGQAWEEVLFQEPAGCLPTPLFALRIQNSSGSRQPLQDPGSLVDVSLPGLSRSQWTRRSGKPASPCVFPAPYFAPWMLE